MQRAGLARSRVVIILLAALLLVPAAPALAFEGEIPDGQIVFGEDYTLAAGDVLAGDLVVFGGDVTLEEGSQVEGDVVVWGGEVEVAGLVEGQLAAFGGDVELRETAVVEGDLAVIGGEVLQEEGAEVRGQQIVNPWEGQSWRAWPLVIPIVPDVPAPPTFDVSRHLLLRLLWRGARLVATSLVMAALAGLVAMLWPRAADRVGRASARAPLPAAGIGLLTIVLIAALLISICLTVFGLLAALAAAVAAVFGWLSLGILIGDRLLKTESTHPFWPAALGTGLLTLLAGLLDLIPCVGWLGSFLIVCLSLGAVILTRFGAQEYPYPYSVSPPRAPAPPAPPAGEEPPPPPAVGTG